MNGRKARKIRETARFYYSEELKRKGITFLNFYRRLKDKYIRKEK